MKVKYLTILMVFIGVMLGFTSCMDDPEEVIPEYTYICDIHEYFNGYILVTDWNDVLYASALPANYNDFTSGSRVIATFTDVEEVEGQEYGFTITINELLGVNTKEVIDVSASDQKDTLATDLVSVYSPTSANKYLNITYEYMASELYVDKHQFYIVYDADEQDKDDELVLRMHHDMKDDSDTGGSSLLQYRGFRSFDFRAFDAMKEKPYNIILYYTPTEDLEQKLIINVPDLEAQSTL
jgi:hypothetical protein